jgi:hypothetical protein
VRGARNGRQALGIAAVLMAVLIAILGGSQPASALSCLWRPIPSMLPLEHRPSNARPDGIAFVGRVDALETLPVSDADRAMGLFRIKMHVSKIRAIRGEVPTAIAIEITPCGRPSAKVGDEVLVTGFFTGGHFHAD